MRRVAGVPAGQGVRRQSDCQPSHSRRRSGRAIREKRPPALVEATICRPELSLRDVEMQLIESQTGFLLLQEQPDGPLVGILPLHDILRAQQTAAEEGYA